MELTELADSASPLGQAAGHCSIVFARLGSRLTWALELGGRATKNKKGSPEGLPFFASQH
jgi:hypothetical protein